MWNPMRRIVMEVGFTLAALGTLTGGCSSDRLGSPTPVHYTLFVSHAPSAGSPVDIIDTDTDSIVGHIPVEESLYTRSLLATKDGKYLAILDGRRGIAIYDASSGGRVALNALEQVPLPSIALASDPARLIALYRDSTVVYNLPSLIKDTVWPRAYLNCVESPKAGELWGITRLWDADLGASIPGFARIDAANGGLIDSFPLICGSAVTGLYLDDVIPSPDGREAYILSPEGLYAFDIADRSCRYFVHHEGSATGFAVTTDGTELWVTNGYIITAPYFPGSAKDAGYILILEASTGLIRDTISTLGLNLAYPMLPLPVEGIVMHPDGERVYVTAAFRPAMLIFNRHSRQLESTLYDDQSYILSEMAIAPH